MANPKLVDAQRDFTAGELDPTAKRADDDPFMKTGMRQLANGRILNTRGITNRPGRNLIAKRSGAARDEDVLMAPGVTYRLSFTNAALTIYDATGAQVFTEAGRAWAGATLGQIVYAVYLKQIFITFPGVVPEVLTWDGATAWSSAAYAELFIGNQKRTPFYRLSTQGITMQPSAVSGAGITLTFSAGMNLVAGHVGTRMRYIGRQLLITAVTDATHATATVEETLFESVNLNNDGTVDVRTVWSVGDVVEGTSGWKGVVTQLPGHDHPIVQLLSGQEPSSAAEVVVGQGGSITTTGATFVRGAPEPVTIWDDEVMNTFRGWPASVFVDQNRLGFCNFPSVPGGVGWSAIASTTDLYVGANPSDGMFELAPGKSRVFHTMSGPESSEFVFCDNAIYYIPISPTNPLRPGSVAFQKISGDGCAAVQPRAVGGVILYVDGGLNQLYSIVATGAYNRPYESEPLTDLHSHLFSGVKAIALPTSVSQFPERYVYVVNGDGTVAVGKYALDKSGNFAGKIGWAPWSGAGAVGWVSALNDVVLFVTSYSGAIMLEQLDASLYLDASLPINAIPTTLTPPGGKGPLWWLPGATVDLMDGRLPLGPHTTDGNGFIIPISPGEDLTSLTLRAGFMWTAIWEPFVPAGGAGQDVGQRVKPRYVGQFEVFAMNSSGFLFAKLYSGQGGPLLPTPGAIVSTKRIAAYNQGDDATQPPPLREAAYQFKPLGGAHDPRVAIIKDTPGPLTIPEIAIRVNV